MADPNRHDYVYKLALNDVIVVSNNVTWALRQ